MIMSMRLARPAHIRGSGGPLRQRHVTVLPAPTAAPRVRYSKARDKSNLFYYTVPPPEGVGVTNIEADEHPVQLTDLRTQPTTLRGNGFELVKLPLEEEIDWGDDQQVSA